MLAAHLITGTGRGSTVPETRSGEPVELATYAEITDALSQYAEPVRLVVGGRFDRRTLGHRSFLELWRPTEDLDWDYDFLRLEWGQLGSYGILPIDFYNLIRPFFDESGLERVREVLRSTNFRGIAVVFFTNCGTPPEGRGALLGGGNWLSIMPVIRATTL